MAGKVGVAETCIGHLQIEFKKKKKLYFGCILEYFTTSFFFQDLWLISTNQVV